MTPNPVQYRNTFLASGTGNYFELVGTAIALQLIGTGTAELQHTNTPDIGSSWSTLATQAATGTATASSERAYGRVVMTGEGTVAVSCAESKGGAGGGVGGGGDASAANQATQISAANLTNTRLLAGLAKDSAGTEFDLESCSRVLAYSGGNLVTDTATLAGVVRVRTYTYTAGDLTGISQWVVQ